MKVTMFAAIEIASYEVSMKIYELSPKTMKEITCVRHRIELGKDAYRLFGRYFFPLSSSEISNRLIRI